MTKTKKCLSLLLAMLLICPLVPTVLTRAEEPPAIAPPRILEEGSYVPGQILVGLADEVALTRNDIISVRESSSKSSEGETRSSAADMLFAGVDILSVKD